MQNTVDTIGVAGIWNAMGSVDASTSCLERRLRLLDGCYKA